MSTLRPDILDRGLNCAVLTMAGKLYPCGFDVAADAPASLANIKRHMAAGRMVVWNGGSERTIYGDDEVNFAFRAWHDWCHWRADADFSLQGERVTCELQVYHLHKVYGPGPTVDKWANILRAEIMGQAEYYYRHKRYVGNQIAFVRHCLALGIESALDLDWS